MIKPVKISQIHHDWHLIDATDQILGRLSTRLTSLLIGKGKNYFTSHLDCGDHVVVVNVEKVKVTGRKEEQKSYQRYSGYPGGLRKQSLAEVRLKYPTRILEHAVAGMLPDNKLKSSRMSRLHLFVGDKHNYGDKFKNNDQPKTSSNPKLTDQTKSSRDVKNYKL